MNKTIRILAVIAVAQLILTVTIWSGDSGLKGQGDKSTLLGFNKTEIDHIFIKDDENEVSLNKKEGKWQTANAFPADQIKVDALLSTLENLKVGLPVTTSSSALQRFKVDDNDYERYVQLQTDSNTVAELYLGTGAGARQTHARNGEQETIYTVAIGSYDAPSKIEDWQDKNILHLDDKSVKAIELMGLKLLRDNAADKGSALTLWKSEILPDNKLVNQAAINDSLQTLLSLRFDKVLGTEIKPEYGLEKPLLELKLVHKEGARHYKFGKLNDANDYVLKVSDRDEYFKITSYIGKPVIEKMTNDIWLMDKPETAKQDQPDSDSKPSE